MYQTNSGYQGRKFSQELTNLTLNHRIDIICLAILFVGLFSCLIRSDYNFAVIFFCYFIWQQRKDSLALKIIFISTIVLLVSDLIFGFVQIRVWVEEDVNNPIWQTLRPMHNFGIFCFSLINILKILLIILSIRGMSQLKKAVQPL